jgi:hypothetical protein
MGRGGQNHHCRLERPMPLRVASTEGLDSHAQCGVGRASKVARNWLIAFLRSLAGNLVIHVSRNESNGLPTCLRRQHLVARNVTSTDAHQRRRVVHYRLRGWRKLSRLRRQPSPRLVSDKENLVYAG